MTVNLEISESIAKSLRLPVTEVAPRLRTELAIALYGQGILSFGKASELAEPSRFVFADLLASRDIPRHYTDDELTQDLGYAHGQFSVTDSNRRVRSRTHDGVAGSAGDRLPYARSKESCVRT